MIFIQSPSTDPEFNLALEEHVFETLGRENDIFMLWRNDNAVIVGKHQNTVEEINVPFVKSRGIKVVRRLSGGGAVYHDMGNLNFTIITSAGETDTLDLHMFALPVVGALREMGLEAELSGRNDMTVAGKKFSGNAQYVKNGRVMHHGTLMFDSDLDTVAQALNVAPDKIESKGIKSVRARVTNLKEHLGGDATLEEFRTRLAENVFRGQKLVRYELTPEDMAAVEKLKAEKYATWDWNFGQSPKYTHLKERRIPGVGLVKLYLEVENGSIMSMTCHGDYFGAEDAAELEKVFLGCRLQEEAVRTAAMGANPAKYFHNMSKEDFILLLLN